MEYTIKKLSNLAGISTRTLRYYDEIALLKPARINSSGYRIYGMKEINKLQLILFYRELGVELNEIKKILDSDDFNELIALKLHQQKLIEQSKRISLLINNIEKTIKMKEGKIMMNDKEKFEGFKKNLVDENEQKYGSEVREKYGEGIVEKSNKQFMNMSKEDYEQFNQLNIDLFETLKIAMKTKDPTSPEAQKAARLHKEWITKAWGKYSKESHAGVANLYVEDPRFTAYYDKDNSGTAILLRDAILFFIENN